MLEWDENAIILRHGQFHERDMWLKMLCENHGIQTVFAFGGCVSKKRFCGCLDTFNILHCHIASSHNGRYLNLREATLLEGTRSLRQNWRRMGVGSNCLKFLEALSIDGSSSGECYKITENLRALLEGNVPISGLAAHFFRLRILAALGFAPGFSNCGLCGKSLVYGFFDVKDGRMSCGKCAGFGARLEISRQLLNVLRHTRDSLPTEWRDKDLTAADRRIFARIIDDFLRYHLGIEWENGYFRHV